MRNTVGKNFEKVFSEYFGNQQTYKHRSELIKDINSELNSQNLNNLFNNSSITQIMIDICKKLGFNLNYLIGVEENMFLEKKDAFIEEAKLNEYLIYDPFELKKMSKINIVTKKEYTSFQTNHINAFFIHKKKYIAKINYIVGICKIMPSADSSSLLVGFESMGYEKFEKYNKNCIEIIAEEIN